MRPVGYYAHHQGAGHWQRGAAIAARLARPCTILGTVDPATASAHSGPVLRLPDDRLGADFAGTDGAANRPLAFHYAPLGHPGLRDRMAAIARWVQEADPVLLIVDVSVEIALFARLLSVPTIVFRLAGSRTDPAHLDAFRSAEALVAPFPDVLEAAGTPAWVKAKTLHAGLLPPAISRPPAPVDEDGSIAVLLGRGGVRTPLPALAAAAAAVPDRAWHVLGDVGGEGFVPPNLRLHGWVADPSATVARASILVGAAGDGALGLAAALGKRLVCLPEPRPYGEQIVKAQALARLGAAVVRDGWPVDWAAVVSEAASLDPTAIASLTRPDGLGWLAGRIDAVAEGLDGRRSERPVVG